MGDSKVLVIGGGGREHALCLGLHNSAQVSEIYCSPGNAGTSMLAKNVDLMNNDNSTIVQFCQDNSIDLVVAKKNPWTGWWWIVSGGVNMKLKIASQRGVNQLSSQR